MLKKLGCYIKDNIYSLKKCILENKLHLYICLGAFAIGILLALSKDFSDVTDTNNFVYAIFSGNSSPIPQIIRLILWCAVFYAIWFITAIHFLSFIVIGYGSILLITYFVFVYAFKAIVVHTLSGLIFTLLYILPTALIVLVGFICALKEIYYLLNYNCNRKSLINLSFHKKSIQKAITPIWILVSLFIFVYWLIFYLILIIFI